MYTLRVNLSLPSRRARKAMCTGGDWCDRLGLLTDVIAYLCLMILQNHLAPNYMHTYTPTTADYTNGRFSIFKRTDGMSDLDLEAARGHSPSGMHAKHASKTAPTRTPDDCVILF